MKKAIGKKLNLLLTFLILFGSMTLLGVADSIHGVTLPLMKTEFGATNQMQGILSAVFTLACVGAGLCCSFLMRKSGTKSTLVISCLMFGIPMLLLPVGGFSYLSSAILFLLMKSAFTFSENGTNGLAANAQTSRPGRTLTLTHFFFGIGASLGPIIASFMINSLQLSWRMAYLPVVVMVLALLGMILITRMDSPAPSPKQKEEKDLSLPSVGTLMKTPSVLLFGITFAFISQTEYVANTWGAIYLEDSFGMDPAVGGAAFLSLFFLFFAASRLVFGLLLDRIGYERVILFCMVCTAVTLVLGFSMGEAGVNVLAFSGFFVAVEWPAMLALMTKTYGRAASVAMSIANTLSNALVVLLQLLIGWAAEIWGGSWGYRMTVPFSILSLGVFLILYIHLRRKDLDVPADPV